MFRSSNLVIRVVFHFHFHNIWHHYNIRYEERKITHWLWNSSNYFHYMYLYISHVVLAYQDSLYNSQSSAWRAFDGKPGSSWSNGDCTHTKFGSSPWWYADLRVRDTVTAVTISNREDCCCKYLCYWINQQARSHGGLWGLSPPKIKIAPQNFTDNNVFRSVQIDMLVLQIEAP